jgi:hypothetical protein
MSGAKIIQGLQDAITGNFSRALVEGQHWELVDGIKRARNSAAWALGRDGLGGFNIRRIVWGRMLARAEKRKGEEIRKATIYVTKASETRPATR